MDDIIGWVIGTIVVGLLLFVVVAIAVSIKQDVFDANYWITQDEKSFSATKIIREDGVCVYFVDAWTDNEGKVCGSYGIKNLTQ